MPIRDILLKQRDEKWQKKKTDK